MSWSECIGYAACSFIYYFRSCLRICISCYTLVASATWQKLAFANMCDTWIPVSYSYPESIQCYLSYQDSLQLKSEVVLPGDFTGVFLILSFIGLAIAFCLLFFLPFGTYCNCLLLPCADLETAASIETN